MFSLVSILILTVTKTAIPFFNYLFLGYIWYIIDNYNVINSNLFNKMLKYLILNMSE